MNDKKVLKLQKEILDKIVELTKETDDVLLVIGFLDTTKFRVNQAAFEAANSVEKRIKL